MSNFSAAHLEALLPQVDVVPAVNQVEVHPYYSQPALVPATRSSASRRRRGRRSAASTCTAPGPSAPRSALADPVVTAIADAHGKTPAQVVLRWHIDSGRSAIPKSVRPERIAENLDVFDFALTADELAAIDALDTGVRGGPDQDAIDFRTFNRTIPEA